MRSLLRYRHTDTIVLTSSNKTNKLNARSRKVRKQATYSTRTRHPFPPDRAPINKPKTSNRVWLRNQDLDQRHPFHGHHRGKLRWIFSDRKDNNSPWGQGLIPRSAARLHQSNLFKSRFGKVSAMVCQYRSSESHSGSSSSLSFQCCLVTGG